MSRTWARDQKVPGSSLGHARLEFSFSKSSCPTNEEVFDTASFGWDVKPLVAGDLFEISLWLEFRSSEKLTSGCKTLMGLET